MKSRIWAVGVLFVASGLFSGTASAFDFQFGGEIRERYESRDHTTFTQSGDSLSYLASRIRLNAGVQVNPDIEAFIQIQDSRLFGAESSTAGNSQNIDLHQGYFTVKNLYGPLSLKVGRQEIVFGDQRLVGNFGWSNIGRSFDGIRATYSTEQADVDLWYTKVAETNGGSITNADPIVVGTGGTTGVASNDQDFLGIYGTIKMFKGQSIEPYVLYLRDRRNASLTALTAPAAADQGRYTLGGRYAGKCAEESIDYAFEGGYQTGVIQKQSISAFAFAGKTGVTLLQPYAVRAGFEVDYASGDDNLADGKFKTFENLFPTNHPLYGFMDLVGWRNMQDFRVSFGGKPTPKTWLGMDYHWFFLANKNDNWYRASGAVYFATPSGNTENRIGQELDLVARATIKEKLVLEAGYGHFFRGAYLEKNFAATSKDQDWGYVQGTVSF